MNGCESRRSARAARRWGWLGFVAGLAAGGDALAQAELDTLAELSLEELADVVVTSVSRRAEPLSGAAASIYVISADDIRRSGAVRLPEALRLAPNLQVARVDASSYAITARGFNNALGNKLLVLIDGRIVYTPLFSGVFWDSQHVLLDDVERIEVISGPGSTLWGSNAVNGVINVITRDAAGTQGARVSGASGEDEHALAARYGGRLGDGYFRLHAQRQRIDASRDGAGQDLGNGWDSAHAGFRADWAHAGHEFRLLADAHRGESEPRLFGPLRSSGQSLSARWRREAADGSFLRVQAYYDRTTREDPIQFFDEMRIADVEFVRSGAPGRHQLMWGGGHRVARDDAEPGLLVAFLPARRDLHWSNLFVQDQFAVSPTLDLVAGLKLDHNTYTGLELLPNARLAWRPGAHWMLWGSLSRAVRTPSRIDREFFLPASPPYLIGGGPDFVSEVSHVAELGFRAQPTPHASYSITFFHHEHDRLRSGQPAGDGSFRVENRIEGSTSGIEAWGSLQLGDDWRLSAGATWLHQDLRLKPGALDPDGTDALGNDPDHHWQLRAHYHATGRLEFNLTLRGVDALPTPAIPGYTTLDLGLGWRARGLELRVLLQDALDEGRIEFQPGLLSAPSEFGRSLAFRATRTW